MTLKLSNLLILAAAVVSWIIVWQAGQTIVNLAVWLLA